LILAPTFRKTGFTFPGHDSKGAAARARKGRANKNRKAQSPFKGRHGLIDLTGPVERSGTFGTGIRYSCAAGLGCHAEASIRPGGRRDPVAWPRPGIRLHGGHPAHGAVSTSGPGPLGNRFLSFYRPETHLWSATQGPPYDPARQNVCREQGRFFGEGGQRFLTAVFYPPYFFSSPAGAARLAYGRRSS